MAIDTGFASSTRCREVLRECGSRATPTPVAVRARTETNLFLCHRPDYIGLGVFPGPSDLRSHHWARHRTRTAGWVVSLFR